MRRLRFRAGCASAQATLRPRGSAAGGGRRPGPASTRGGPGPCPGLASGHGPTAGPRKSARVERGRGRARQETRARLGLVLVESTRTRHPCCLVKEQRNKLLVESKGALVASPLLSGTTYPTLSYLFSAARPWLVHRGAWRAMVVPRQHAAHGAMRRLKRSGACSDMRRHASSAPPDPQGAHAAPCCATSWISHRMFAAVDMRRTRARRGGAGPLRSGPGP